jgi:predicted DNA-binding transcriptional regulator AlpA
MWVSDDDLLSMQETAQALGVSMPALYTIVDKRHEIEPAETRQLGRQRRRYFRRGDVEMLRRRRAGETV